MANKVYEYYNDTYTSYVYLVTGTPHFCANWMVENLHLNESETQQIFDCKNYEGVTMDLRNADGGLFGNVIYMPKIDRTPESVSTLMHELLHATVNILSPRGIKAEDSNGETCCYLLGAMATHFLKECKLITKPKTKRRKK